MSKNITEMSKEELAKVQKELETLRAGKEKAAVRAERLRVKNTLLVQKAKVAGLVVSEAEVDTYIKNMVKK